MVGLGTRNPSFIGLHLCDMSGAYSMYPVTPWQQYQTTKEYQIGGKSGWTRRIIWLLCRVGWRGQDQDQDGHLGSCEDGQEETHVCVLACSVSCNSNSLVTPWIVAHQHLCPWDFPGKNTGVGFHFPLQGIFLTQGSNPRLLHGQVCSLPLSPQGSPQEETCTVEVCSTAGLQ